MGRMRYVYFPICFAKERHKKAVSESLGTIFNTYIGAPLKIVNRIDFARQCTESILDVLYLLIRSIVLELEQHHMTQDLGRFFGVLRLGFSSVIRSVLWTDTQPAKRIAPVVRYKIFLIILGYLQNLYRLSL